MFNLNIWDFPKRIKLDIIYIIFYTFISIIPNFIIITFILNTTLNKNISDNIYLMLIWIFSFLSGFLIWVIKPIPEIVNIKRNNFVAWILHILWENKVISFDEMILKYSFCLFWNKKIILPYREYSKILIILINLEIITLVNQKNYQKKCDEFDFKFFEKNINEMEFLLKNKKYDLEKLMIQVNELLY